jgi:hypothetical protein
MSLTFVEIIAKAQTAITRMMEGQNYNPISVISAEVANICIELTQNDLTALIQERPTIMRHQPGDRYLSRTHSGEQVIRACVQMEVETEIDMMPFKEAVAHWATSVYQPPKHLREKMQAILNAT